MDDFVNVIEKDPQVRVKINDMLDITDYHLNINRE